MVNVTEHAAQHLRELLAATATAPEQAFRIHVESDEFSLEPDYEQKGDEVVKSEGTAILFMVPEVSSLLAGLTIHCIDTPEGVGFAIGAEEELLHGECDCGCNGHQHEE